MISLRLVVVKPGFTCFNVQVAMSVVQKKNPLKNVEIEKNDLVSIPVDPPAPGSGTR